MKEKVTVGLAASVRSGMLKWLGLGSIALALMVFPLLLDPGLELSLGSAAYAQGGNGGNNGGGGGSGNGTGGGNGDKGGGKSDKGTLYGDMIYLQRDINGIPVVDDLDCTRPVASDGTVLPLYWEYLLDPEMEVPAICQLAESPAMFTFRYRAGFEPAAEAEAGELGDCDVIPECADDTVAVDLGRLSVLRSPDKVLDRHRDEAIRNILRAEDDVLLDANGRLVVAGLTFDSPLINLALLREFHVYGELQYGVTTVFDPDEFFEPSLHYPYDFFMASAFGLGAGDDKEGTGVDPEVVARANAILGLADLDPVTGTIIDPQNAWLGKFIDYTGFSYSRTENYPGCIEYDWYDGTQWQTANATIIDAVFGGEDPGVVVNVAGYAMAADDARRVLVFTHDLGDAALRGRVDSVFENSGQWCP